VEGLDEDMCVRREFIGVIVNGCPTQEIPIMRGLKKGYPLAPLLFLLVAEGLGGLMRSVVAKIDFARFLLVEVGLRCLCYNMRTIPFV
jgi:hypothetical protein